MTTALDHGPRALTCPDASGREEERAGAVTLFASGQLEPHKRAMLEPAPVSFSRDLMNSFSAASHDRNPLHLDAEYARLSPFGEPVVFGMLGVLAALGKWAHGRAVRLREIQGKFLRPLQLGVQYDLEVAELGPEVKLSLTRGARPFARLKFVFDERRRRAGTVTTFPFDPISIPRCEATALASKIYVPDHAARDALCAQLGLELDDLACNTFLWASYVVGMDFPGRQALFTGFSFKFGDESPPHLAFDDLQGVWNERLGLVTLTGKGPALWAAKITASRRPDPVRYSYSEVAEAVGDAAADFRGRVAFVSGASRGFGAVFAKALAANGAHVLVNQRSRGADDTVNEIRAAGREATAIEADLTSPACAEAIESAVNALGRSIDLIVLNATPPIPDREFIEAEAADWLGFVEASLAMCLGPLQAVLPHARDDATIVLISSIYVTDPPRGFSHYAAAKAAQEALCHTLAREQPGKRIRALRLPRMLTDQTASAFYGGAPPLSPLELLSWTFACVQRGGLGFQASNYGCDD